MQDKKEKSSTQVTSYILGILAVLVVVLSVSTYLFNQNIDKLINANINENLETNTANQREYVVAVFEAQLRTLESMAAYIGSVENYDKNDFYALSKGTVQIEDFTQMGLSDTEGNRITSDYQFENVTDCEYYQKSMQGIRLLSGSNAYSKIVNREEQHGIVMSVPVKTSSGKIKGVLSGIYGEERLAELLQESCKSSGKYAMITDSKGNIVLSSQCSFAELKNKNILGTLEEMQFTEENDIEIFSEDMLNDVLSSISVRDGEEKIFVSQVPLGYNDWKFIVVRDADEWMEMYGFIQKGTGFLSFAMLLTLALCVLVLMYAVEKNKGIMRVERERINRENAQLAIKAKTDAVTGTYNKAATVELISEKLALSENLNSALMLIDIDDLKGINDNLGHFEGDRAIFSVAEILNNHFRASDIVGRIGGDEFMVFLEDLKSEEQVCSMAASLIRRFSAVYIGEDNDYPLRISVGIVMKDNDENNYESLYKKADFALYHVKRNGKNGYALYSADMNDEHYEYRAQSELCLLRTERFSDHKLKKLLSAVASFFTVVIFVNLTKSTYNLMETDTNTEYIAEQSGNFDEFVKGCISTYHPDDREYVSEILSRDNLIRAKSMGDKCVSYDCRQTRDGEIKFIHVDGIFAEDDLSDNGDIYMIFFARATDMC